MKRYRRLNEGNRKKMKRTSSTMKWVSIVSGILIISSAAVVAFYKFVDIDSNENGENNNDVQYEIASSEEAVNIIDNGEKLEGDRGDVKEENEDVETKDEVSDKKDSNSKQDSKKQEASGNEGHDFSQWNKTCEKELIVVNGDNFLDEDYKVKTKVCRGKEISSLAAENLEKMIVDAKKEGILLWISSGYRSIELQTKLFNRQVEREKSKGLSKEEAQKKASTVVAKPGTSEHNTGLAVDFNGVEDDFYKTKEYKWLIENAHKYGFIERYKKQWQKITGVIYEPWHFRYVGEYHAGKIKESEMCLEEYVSKVLKG